MPRKLSKQSTSTSLASTTSTNTSSTTSTSSTTAHSLSHSLSLSLSQSPFLHLLPAILRDNLPLPRCVVFDLDYTLWPFWVDTHVYGPLKPADATHSACVDKVGEIFRFYKDVPAILHCLSLVGVRLGIASRTHAPDLGRDMLKLLHVPGISGSCAVSSRAAVSAAENNNNTSGPNPSPTTNNNSTADSGKGNTKTSSKDKEREKEKEREKPRKAIDFFDAGLEIYPSSKTRHFEALHRRTAVPYQDILFFDDEARNRDTEALGLTMWLVRDGLTWPEVEAGIREWRRRRGVE